MNPNYSVHKTSVVDPGAVIGEGTKIWHFCHIMSGAKIGKNCILGQNVFIGADVQIGDGVKIQNNVSVFKGVVLEDGVFCGPSLTFTNVINPRSAIERKHQFQKTRVKKGATLGAHATILCGITIGAYAMIGAGAVVTEEVPDFGLAYGVPCRLKGWVCICGKTLSFPKGGTPQKARCPECQRDYRRGRDTLKLIKGNRDV